MTKLRTQRPVHISLWIACGALVVLALPLWWGRAKPEPIYQGKKVTEWIANMKTANLEDEAGNALAAIGPQAVPYLVRTLGNESILMKSYREKVYLGFRQNLPGVARFLPRPSDEPYVGTRAAAAFTLGRIGPQAKAAVPALIRAARDADLSVRMHSTQSLGLIGSAAVQASPILIERLNEPDPLSRWIAARALAHVGCRDTSAIPGLTALLNSTNANFACSAAVALWQIQPKPERFLVMSNYLRAAPAEAAYVLGGMAERARSALPLLKAELQTTNETVRRAVGKAIQRIEGSRE